MRFDVVIHRVEYSCAVIGVEADSEEEARERANEIMESGELPSDDFEITGANESIFAIRPQIADQAD